MTRRKHIKRIDPRYFLNETATREEDLEEGCPHADEGEAIDIEGPGVDLQVNDISDLPPEGEGPLQERSRLNEAEGEAPEDVAQRISNMPAMFRHSVINDIRYMAKGSKEMIGYYPHVENHVEFAMEVLRLLGEG